MFRVFFGVLTQTTKSIINRNNLIGPNILKQSIDACGFKNPSQIGFNFRTQFSTLHNITPAPQLLSQRELVPYNSIRTVTKYSFKKGKRKSVSVVLTKFYRLNWGGWIRTKCGRNKKLWKKSSARKRRLRQHVFCNATQSTLLDKMVGSYWRKPKYYVDDPYEPYHTREDFIYTSKKPRPYIPPPNID